MNNAQVLQLLQNRIGSADWSKWGIYRWVWYDYVRYPGAGTTQLQFFVNPLGTVDPTSALAKTLEQTNGPKSRAFGQTFFVIQEIRTHVHILPKLRQPAALATDADLLYTTIENMMEQFYDLIGAGVLSMQIGQKDYFELEKPFKRCPPGLGVEIFQHGALSDFCMWIQQSPHTEDIWGVTPAQMVEPEQTINLNIDFPQGNPATFTNLVNSATPSVDIGVLLDGYIARPAQ